MNSWKTNKLTSSFLPLSQPHLLASLPPTPVSINPTLCSHPTPALRLLTTLVSHLKRYTSVLHQLSTCTTDKITCTHFYIGNSVTYLIRINFRADKISRIFAHNLNLREIARKLVPKFWSFVTGARKFIRAKIFKLYILKKAIQKSCFSQNLARNCSKISTEFWIFMEGARKFFHAKISTNKRSGIIPAWFFCNLFDMMMS